MDKILICISNILHYQSEREEKEVLLSRVRRSLALIGETVPMVQLKQMIARVAPTSSWVLLSGEHGAGKNLVAQNIHYMSPRAGRPFVEVVCSNLPEELMETELFGFEKGAFPGADKAQKGKVELAAGGTLFLEDIADLSPFAQERLLRVLQERKFQRVGGGETIHADVRVMAATRARLDELVKAGQFREDLYHRLNVVPLEIPALRARTEDLPALVMHFSDLVAKEGGFQRKEFSEKAYEVMGSYAWPGNVRELKNFVERVYILTPGEFVDVHDVRFAGLAGDSSETSEFHTFREARAAFEKEFLIKKIQENNGNISRTAEVIGLERSYLHRKIKSFGLDVQKGNEDQV